MGLKSQTDRLYGAQLGSSSIRQIILPVGAAAVATANAAGSTYGAWVDVALLATVLQETLITGVVVSDPSATDVFTVGIGSTFVLGVYYANAAAVIAGGVAVIAAAHRAEVRVDYTVVGAAGYYLGGYLPLLRPIYVPLGAGIIARCYGITAVAVTIDVSAVCVQGW